MTMDSAIVFSYSRAAPGREEKALQAFTEGMAFFGSAAHDGKCAEPITVMGPSGTNTDEDLFGWGTINAGNAVELTVRLPATGRTRIRLSYEIEMTGALIALGAGLVGLLAGSLLLRSRPVDPEGVRGCPGAGRRPLVPHPGPFVPFVPSVPRRARPT